MMTPRYLFFTGKGGVGKTSLACATALKLAHESGPTLIVSTDPASNLDEVLGTALGDSPVEITGMPGLFGANLDPEVAAQKYREVMVGPYRGKLPPAVIRSMEEQFSGACTIEIAAFDEFVRLMSNPDLQERFSHIVFDTAPTGHTLRLLSLPGAWSGYLETTTSVNSCLGPLAGLKEKQHQYETALRHLSDQALTQVVLVTRPEKSALREAARSRRELSELGIENLSLIVNAMYPPVGTELDLTNDPIAKAFAHRVWNALDQFPPDLLSLKTRYVSLLPHNVVGRDALYRLAELPPTPGSEAITETVPQPSSGTVSFSDLVAALEKNGKGVIMTMGKGGVGKTTVAAKIAIALAQRGHPVTLTTTDPAGDVETHVSDALPNLTVTRIDPAEEVRKYGEATLQEASKTMDQAGLDLLREDLRSPCTEEIAVFRAFAEAVQMGDSGFVVIDTAPTGHTILLMDATEAYHREVTRTQSSAPESVKQLLPRLRDPDFTKVILVALPEPTPVHEARRLQEDLERAGIVPTAWVINRSLAAAGVTEPMLAAKAMQEFGPMNEASGCCSRLIVLPFDPLA